MSLYDAPASEVGRYSMVIEWSDVDAAYIVTVPELPGCRTHGVTTVEEAEMGREAIEGWLAAQRARGNIVPPPRIYDRFYSESDTPAAVTVTSRA